MRASFSSSRGSAGERAECLGKETRGSNAFLKKRAHGAHMFPGRGSQFERDALFDRPAGNEHGAGSRREERRTPEQGEAQGNLASERHFERMRGHGCVTVASHRVPSSIPQFLLRVLHGYTSFERANATPLFLQKLATP